ncbi:MAG: ABC transporter ATP-binding protein [Opitutales bacterium]|nr:ABC transporter ATP-binding protein [Opitutales bacterium]
MKLIRTYAPYLKPHSRAFILAILAGVIAGAASGLGIPFFTQKVFKAIFENTERIYSTWYLIGVAALLPASFVVRGIADYFNQYLMSYCGINVLRSLRQTLFDKLQTLPIAYFEKNHSGDMLSRILTDTTQIQTSTMIFAAEACRQPFTVIGGIGYLVYMSYQQKESLFLLMFMGLVPVMLIPVKLIGRHLKHRSRQVQATLGEVTEHLSENLHANVEVRSFNLQRKQSLKFGNLLYKHFNFFMKQVKYEKLTQPLMENIAVIVLAISFVYAYKQHIDFNTFIAMGMALYFTADALKRFMKAVNELQKAQGAFERVDDILAIQPEITSPETPVKVKKIDGNIRFEEVTFAYGDSPVLKSLSTEIQAGTACALVGPSGAGKSTFIKLVPRFYDSQSGCIRIDGTSIKDFSLEDLRENIAIVPQAPILFNDTIANNIRLGDPNANMDQIVRAAKAAQAYDFIEGFEEGFETVVGENATRLSGGQRQRIALARAFLKAAPILILDEATSALDSESEAKIQLALDTLIEGKTVLIVAHRFSTIKKCKTILVFDGGEIIARGTHDELISSCPLYKQLYERQI